MNLNDTISESGSSILYRLDPRVKLICVAAFSIVVALSHQMSALIFAVFLTSVVVILSGVPAGKLLHRMIVANVFIAVLWLFLPFTMTGSPLFSVGPIEASKEGARYAAMLTLRSNAIILVMIVLMATTSVTSIVHALTRLRIPDSVVYLFFFTYRYAHEIVREYTRIHNAMKIRCFTPGTNIHTYKSYAYLVGMLLVNSYERGLRIRAAMICRGFTGKFPSFDSPRIRHYDIVAMVVTALTLAGMVMFNVG
ncbi:MAG: cobalt ECF transporter T component CbiQ [Deltaproteobacteria bacterium]|nr:cobalt ECF transporter T component CbiQ [Deltaproteobacteria bacterium]